MFEIDPNKKRKLRETGKSGVEERFVRAVAKAGGKAYKFTSENNRGVSDRLVLFPGQVWFVEIKRDGGKLTPLQELFREYILQKKLNHFVVYGLSGIDQFLEGVQQYDPSRKT